MPKKWFDIVGYEGFYQITKAGEIKRIGPGHGARVGLILKPGLSSGGYPAVELRTPLTGRRRVVVHRLLAATFLQKGPLLPGVEVNHKDGIKTNFRLSNLEITTRQGNVDHAWRTGLTDNSGSKCSFARLKDADISAIRQIAPATWTDCAEVAKQFGVSTQTIRRITTNRTWRR